jgi:hypothetical protein
MGYEIMTENEGRGVVVKWSGVASAKDITAINDETYSEGRAARLRYQIWDFTKAVKAKTPQVSFEDARLFAIQDGRARNQTPGMLIALVGKKEYFDGMETFYGIYADVWAKGVICRVFEGIEEARACVADECPEL